MRGAQDAGDGRVVERSLKRTKYGRVDDRGRSAGLADDAGAF